MKTKRVGQMGQTVVRENGNSSFIKTVSPKVEILPPLMTQAEALQAVGEINSSLNRIRGLLVELEARQGYAALGFENMSQLMQSDLFSKARSTLQRELQAGRIERHYLNVPVGTFPERHFRPLSKLKPEYYQSAFEQAFNSAEGGLVTEKHVNRAVAELLRSQPETSKKGIVEQLRERTSTCSIPCQPGDVVVVHCDRRVKEPYTQYNGYWVTVKEILSHSCKVQLLGKELCITWNDLKEMDLADETLKSVAIRIEELLQREDLDDMEREILESYHRRQWFSDWQLQLLTTIENIRHSKERQ